MTMRLRMTDAIGVFEQVEHEMSLAMRWQLRKRAGPNAIVWHKMQLAIGEYLSPGLIGIIGDPSRTAVSLAGNGLEACPSGR